MVYGFSGMVSDHADPCTGLLLTVESADGIMFIATPDMLLNFSMIVGIAVERSGACASTLDTTTSTMIS